MAARRAEGEERVGCEAEGLADLGHRMGRAQHQGAVRRLVDFDDEVAGHGLAVRVERDRAAEGGLEAEPGQGLAEEPLPVAEPAAGLFEGEEQRLGVDVVGEGEQARRRTGVREARAVGLRKRGPGPVVFMLGDGQRRHRPQQQGAARVVRREQPGAQGRGAGNDGGLPAGRAVGPQKARRRTGLEGEEQRIGLGAGKGLGEACGVARTGGDPVLCHELAAEGAEFHHESHELRVGQGIVLGDRDDPADALALVDMAPETRDPLHAVGGEAEEVPGRRAQGGVLCRRGAVDECHLGHARGEVADRDALDPGEGADDDAGAALDQQTGLRGHRVRRPVGGFDEGLDGPPAGLPPVLLHGQLVAAQGVLPERRERAFEGGEHADPEAAVVGCGRHGGGEQRGGEERRRRTAKGARRETADPSAAAAA